MPSTGFLLTSFNYGKAYTLFTRHRGLCLTAFLVTAFFAPLPADATYRGPSFVQGQGTSAVTWILAPNSPSGTITGPQMLPCIYYFQDSAGETSTMEIDGEGQITWTINLQTGDVLTYADGLSSGQPGAFVQTGGNTALNTVSAVNKHPFTASGSLLLPTQQPASVANIGLPINAFVFNGVTYQVASTGYDMNGMAVNDYASSTSTCVVRNDSPNFEIGFADGTFAYYVVDSHAGTYTLQASSTAGNLLTQINGYPLSTAGDVATLPSPSIKSFVWNGGIYSVGTLQWIASPSSNGWALGWNYFLGSGLVSGAGMATYGTDGSLLTLTVADFSQDTSSLQSGTNVGTYYIISSQGTSAFTAFNEIPYVTIGSSLYPEGPVGNFTYAGDVYQFSGSSQSSDGNTLASYQSTNGDGGTASLEWSPATGTMVNLKVNPASGGTATYVNGESVGRPGAFVWSTNSTATNTLTQVNNNAYTASGDMALASNAWTDSNGVFGIQGDFMSLGSWSNNSSHFGFSLSYDDGEPVTVPASIELTASRPSTAWWWDAATSDGTGVSPVMQIDQNSRLLLYPVVNTNTTSGPAVPPPSVILDPSPTNPSDFTGVVRFEGPVRIAPQGDLSMGTFIQDAFPAQPTQ